MGNGGALDGIPLKKLVEFARPYAGAKSSDETFLIPRCVRPTALVSMALCRRLTAEANNELALLATGIYGKPMPNQNGAPIRLVLPWKYGFKSIKSIRRITFTDKNRSVSGKSAS